MTMLRLSRNLSLPLESVTQKFAWLGVTGSGKTYGASKLAELLWHEGAQFVVLDPVGVWYGLRLAKNGKRPSAINLPIFGGLHGDVPLEPTSGVMVANLIVDKSLSAIIDVSQFESDTQKARFAMDFAERFFFRKKAAPAAVHLFLEECQEFVPQNPQKGEERMLHAFIRMQKLGRNFGIGSSYLSQRPQEVNKKALNMAQTLFVFRTTGTHERAAIEKWIEDKALDQDIAGDLPKIATGHCHVWSPEFLKISETVHILEKDTFNASATPEVGAAAKSRELAPIDLDQIRVEMAATIEKAKAEDPRELRNQISKLNHRIRELVRGRTAAEVKETIKEVPALTDGQLRQIESINTKAHSHIDGLVQIINDLKSSLSTVVTQLHLVAVGSSRRRDLSRPVVQRGTQRTDSRGHGRLVANHSAGDPGSSVRLGAGELKILTAVAQYSDGVTREQLTVLTGYKRSSRDTYLQRLAQAGDVIAHGGNIVATGLGREVLGADFEPLPTGEALQAYWLNRLGGGEQALLKVLIDNHPASLDREKLSDETGYKRSSRDTYLQRLSARQLIVADRGSVRASDLLFD